MRELNMKYQMTKVEYQVFILVLSHIFRESIISHNKAPFDRPSKMDKKLFCILLHHSNPFLRMGPFKFECLNMQPELGFVHDIISVNQTSKMKDEAKRNMRSTPFGSGSYAGNVLKGPYFPGSL